MEEGGSSGVGKRENQAFTSFQRDLTMSFGGQKELSHVRGQGQRPRVPGCNGAGTAEKSYPTSEVRGGSWEELTHIQGAVASKAQEGLEGLFHDQGQEGRW